MNDILKSAHVAFPIADVFDLVEAVERYPEFLPWCAAATVLSRNDTEVSARITVGYGDLRFHFVTRNPMRRPEFMAIHLEEGPFRQFEGEWHLSRLGVDACKIEFALRYEFENPVIAALAGSVFGQMADTLVDAFVRRADQVHGGQAAAHPEAST